MNKLHFTKEYTKENLKEKEALWNKLNPNVEYEFQEIGINIEKHFKQNTWFIFYKYPLWQIKQAYDICKSKGNHALAYFLGIIKKL